MARESTLEKFRSHIFDDCEDLTLSDAERKQLVRLRAVATLQLERPSTPNTEIVSMLSCLHGVSTSQAYRDIASTQILLGSVPNASKQWIRYMVVESLKSVIETADRTIEDQKVKEDAGGMDGRMYYDNEIVLSALDVKTKAADKLAKYARLDQSDPDPIPYDEIVPLDIDYVNDPSILTGKKIDDPKAAVAKVLAKYSTYEEIEG